MIRVPRGCPRLNGLISAQLLISGETRAATSRALMVVCLPFLTQNLGVLTVLVRFWHGRYGVELSTRHLVKTKYSPKPYRKGVASPYRAAAQRSRSKRATRTLSRCQCHLLTCRRLIFLLSQGGKRPYHTIIPALATRGDELFLSYGVMGAYMQVGSHRSVVRRLEPQRWL